MKSRLWTLIVIWATVKTCAWIYFFYGPDLINKYSDRTGALFIMDAQRILKRDLEFPRKLYWSSEQMALNGGTRMTTKDPLNLKMTSNQSYFLVGELDVTVLDLPTPERSYNGKIMCQVFFTYEFKTSSDFSQVNPSEKLAGQSLVQEHTSQINQVTLEKDPFGWRVQDKQNVVLSLPGVPAANTLGKWVSFLSPFNPW